MIKNNSLDFFLTQKSKTENKPKERPLDGLCDDIDGDVDEAWREAMKKYVPEVLWNPDHPFRKTDTKIWGVSTTKGGKGSGNWGHDGLSGVHGGSSPTKTASPKAPQKLGIAPTEIKPDLQLLTGNTDKIRETATKMNGFSGTDAETGFTVKGDSIKAYVNELPSGNSSVEVSYKGYIYDQDDNSVGEVSLSYYPASNSGKIDFIWLSRDSRKTGFGRRYIDHVENVFFDDMKVNSIDLIAALDVGGYFWARAGYDFTKSGDKREAINWFQKEWNYRYSKEVPKNIMNNLNHTWDIATVVGPDNFPIGKQAMLGTGWRGQKTPDGLGRKIGKEYFGIDG